ncbi:hypothetical protein ACFSTC_11790 [Nonomuraea ferruginea]
METAAGRGRSGEGAVRARAQTAARTRTRTQSVAKGVKSRAEGATTLPAGNTALLLLAVLAVPCVVASVMWPIASIGITAVFVVLTRALWMSHWMVRNHAEGWLRATMRAVTLPFALSGALASAAVWPGAPVAVAARRSAVDHRRRSHRLDLVAAARSGHRRRRGVRHAVRRHHRARDRAGRRPAARAAQGRAARTGRAGRVRRPVRGCRARDRPAAVTVSRRGARTG